MGDPFVELSRTDAARDAEELFGAALPTNEHAEALWSYMAYGPFPDVSAMRDWLGDRAVSRDPAFYTVRDIARDAVVGMAALSAIDPDHRRLEVAHIWYGPAAQRGVTNTETVRLLLGQAFERRYRRVEWKCDASNDRSRTAALRLGFVLEARWGTSMIHPRYPIAWSPSIPADRI